MTTTENYLSSDRRQEPSPPRHPPEELTEASLKITAHLFRDLIEEWGDEWTDTQSQWMKYVHGLIDDLSNVVQSARDGARPRTEQTPVSQKEKLNGHH
ncbi:MAG: hypothetical protein AAF481_16315 [Acidobacteriota bacterium]